jgi:hypothetical protein
MAEKNRRRLDVLAYRCTPELLGGAAVHVREFPEGVRSLWRLLERNYQDRTGRDEAQPPYSVAINALRCLTGGYAHFNPGRLFLVTRDPVDDDLLCDAFTLMSRLAAGDEIDDIDLAAPTQLAERIAGTPQQQRLLAEYLRKTEAGQPDATPWVYQSATWDLSRRLTQGTWTVDGLDITLRPDSEGGFIAWDQPWSTKDGTAHSLARCRMVMKTMPNIGDPLILLSPAASRVKSSMAFARTVLAAQDDPGRPIIEVEMAGRDRIRTISRMSLQTLARLGMDHSVLRAIQDRVDQERQAEQAARARGAKKWYPPGGALGPIRPIQSKNYRFPIGHGVGMHFLRELDVRFRNVIGDTAASPQIYFDIQGFKRLSRKDGLYADPADVARSLKTMGYSHLRLVCLWYTDDTRLRMLQGLCDAYGLNPQLANPVDGVPFPLHAGTVSSVFHEVPKFLIHGPEGGSDAGIAKVSALQQPEPGILTGVWAETEYRSAEEEIAEADEQDNREPREQPATPKDDQDAKPRARRTLARKGVVSQFITARDPADKGEDHPVIMAQLDLNRSLGIIDRRIDNVMTDPIGSYSATGIGHCGIFVRRQSKRRGENSAKICITAAALVPPASSSDAWTLHGWSYMSRQWQPYHQAQAAYHAQDYPVGRMTELDDDNQGYRKVARVIDQALGDLARYLSGISYTVTIDGLATRRLWGGLHNNKQGQLGKPGTTWLPGHTLPLGQQPIAIIRVNKEADEIPRPVRVTRLSPHDEVIDSAGTTELMYRVETDFADPAWLLITVPPQYDGAGAGRLGDKKTRWTADYGSSAEGDRRRNEMRATWYAMNATEIYVIPVAAAVDCRALAKITARLCHQPLAWTERTRYPVHLHAAEQMDLDHPQYRRSALSDDPAAAQPAPASAGDNWPDSA